MSVASAACINHGRDPDTSAHEEEGIFPVLLEQIVRRQEEQRERLERKKNMKVGIIPASELDPKKGLRAKNYLGGTEGVGNPGATPDKTMGLKLPGSMHERMEKLVKNPRIIQKSKKAIALRALEIGIKVLESR